MTKSARLGRAAAAAIPAASSATSATSSRHRTAGLRALPGAAFDLRERQPAMDYGRLEQLARRLGMFWADLERHHPGIDSLHLSA